MAKRKKKSVLTDEKKTIDTDLTEKIKKITAGLSYTSETDAKIVPFVGEKVETITDAEVVRENKSPADTPVEERDFAEIFGYLTQIQEWFGDEEKATAAKFCELKELLENNLRDLKVYRIGKIQIDIYVIGLDSENNMAGIKTKAVET